MSLEEQLIAWAATRPSWQRWVLKQVAKGEPLADEDYDRVVNAVVTSSEVPDADFGPADLPEAKAGDPPVKLASIIRPEHVNALDSATPLTFGEAGLTIVYGDNASGKSGYARLLKRIARARHQEDILSDVFRDTAAARPKADLVVKIGDDERALAWPSQAVPELQRMLFFDRECGDAYIDNESDLPYRPSALFVMDGLIQACLNIRARIDARLSDNSRLGRQLPFVEDEVKDSDIGRYLASLSAGSSIKRLDELLAQVDASGDTVRQLAEEEQRLRSVDTTRERQRLTRIAGKLDALGAHLVFLDGMLGAQGVAVLEGSGRTLRELEDAAAVLARDFSAEPLPGVGRDAWKELWESARKYSLADAYPQRPFPVVSEDARCVLCQQTLELEARERLAQFERFTREDTQTRLREARARREAAVARLSATQATPEAIDAHLRDLETDYPDLSREARTVLTAYEPVRDAIVTALRAGADIPRTKPPAMQLGPRLDRAAAQARAAAAALSDPETAARRLTVVIAKRIELELLERAKTKREDLAAEIARLKERDALEAAKNAATTGPITRKVLELSEATITEMVRDTFTRETERLQLDRVTISQTRGDHGALLHQPKLVGARQDVPLPRVFSEGERTALGLAAFFTEALLDTSQSALILDDPVNSLDHVRRALVASRLASLAANRQVVVFTHDVSFVADLKREAAGLGVPIVERSVARGRGGERRPGTCSTALPWKARDVRERLGYLRTELARIKRESPGWDTDTYEREVGIWAGNLSETWERIVSQELVGLVLGEGGLEVRPTMLKVLARFTDADDREYQASYRRASEWAKRHDKSALVNYVPPEPATLEEELGRVDQWFNRVKAYKN